jgi:peptidase M28-like protein/PDZ domain-containing protein/PA domain-containing protein
MKSKSASRISLTLTLIAALALAAGAQRSQPPTVPSVARLRQHVEYLASDKLEGRRTGSAGATLAGEYIAREFSRYGLRRSIGRDLPGMSILEADSPNRYLQKFPYVAGVALGKNNVLKVNVVSGNSPETQGSFKTQSSDSFQVGQDWSPLGLSTQEQIEDAPAVLVGYGLTVSELKYDDYVNADVKGKIAVAFSGTPDGDNPHGQFARYEDVRWKAIAARTAGAKALLVIVSESNFKDDRLSRLHYDNSAGDSGLPVAAISRQVGARLLSADSSVLAELEQRLRINNPHRDEDQPRQSPVQAITITLATDLMRNEVQAANVVGILDGSDPVLKKEVIVIGAHYDHLGYGGDGSLAPKEGEIHHGADDNASGTAGVLELARMFAAQHPRPRRTLAFIAFSGEEEGLLGSNYYVNHPIVPLADTVAMINMDMIGRMKDKKLIVGGVGTASEWRGLVDSANLELTPSMVRVRPSRSANDARPLFSVPDPKLVPNARLPQLDLTLNEDGYGPSDHSSFYIKQIPVLFFWTGTHEDYHKPSDTADKINYEGQARIVALVWNLISDIDITDARPSYTVAKSESTGRTMSFRVYLGTIPNYADSNDGLLLDGVREDSPAAKAGIKAGDRIVKLAGKDVKNVYDYTYALGEMKAGQEYEVELMRAGERITLKLTPAARK